MQDYCSGIKKDCFIKVESFTKSVKTHPRVNFTTRIPTEEIKRILPRETTEAFEQMETAFKQLTKRPTEQLGIEEAGTAERTITKHGGSGYRRPQF